MKLFAKLLVAPAALGLLAPISASANELDLGGIDSYSLSEEIEPADLSSSTFSKDLASKSTLQYKVLNDTNPAFEAGSFSETTVLSGSASFAATGGSGDFAYGDDEALQVAYYLDIDLDTTFTGEDNLNVGIEAGNTPTSAVMGSTGLDFGTGAGDGLKVIDVNYTRTFGDLTLTIGDSLKISKAFDGACTYSGFHTTLSDCGTGAQLERRDVTLTGNYDLGNGFTVGAEFQD